MNGSWTIFGFIISSWTVHELMMNCSWMFIHVNFSGTIDELFMNYFFSWQVLEQFMNCDGELFMNFSSWTNNASILWTFHELFMNVHECSWTVHKVMNYISPGQLWHWSIKFFIRLYLLKLFTDLFSRVWSVMCQTLLVLSPNSKQVCNWSTDPEFEKVAAL